MAEIDLISMKNALFILKRQIEVRGEYALSYGNAIAAIEKGVHALDNARKEAEKNADHDEQGKNV